MSLPVTRTMWLRRWGWNVTVETNVKCLSLTQPYATLMALGLKRIETRSWATQYRGPLVIHAAKGFPPASRDLCETEPFKGALASYGITSWRQLPLGALLATVRLCVILDIVGPGAWWFSVVPGLVPPVEPERSYGNYTAGRCAWLTSDACAFSEPIPYRGRLGLFDVVLP